MFCFQQTDTARKTDVFCICYISKSKQNLAKKKKTGHCLLHVTLVPEAIYGGSEERSKGEKKSPLVENGGNFTSMLSPSTEIEPQR